jgi:hypothetical protein
MNRFRAKQFKGILIFGLFILVSLRISGSTDPELYYSEALRYYDQKLVEPAFNYVNRAISENSNVAKYHLLRGNILMLRQDRIEAEKSYRTSLRLDPDNKALAAFYEQTFRQNPGPEAVPRKSATGKKASGVFDPVFDIKKPYVEITAGLYYEWNDHESIPGIVLGGEWVNRNLTLGFKYSRSLFTTALPYLNWFSHFNFMIGYKIDLSDTFSLDLRAGCGFSGYSYHYFPEYADNRGFTEPVLQGGNLFISPVFRLYFSKYIGIFLGMEYLYTGVSDVAVFNGFFTPGTVYIKKNVFSLSLGIAWRIEP